ncbi:Uncharacterised protein [Mycobacteroides abscessus subsp. abscessus]|nr:Uncharacterised protein [Mycobacteroides abscessus subsp. abscessus]
MAVKSWRGQANSTTSGSTRTSVATIDFASAGDARMNSFALPMAATKAE